MKTKLLKTTAVVLGAMVLSTLGIFASDKLRGIEGGIEQLAGAKKSGVCDAGAVPLKVDGFVLCVDMYEVSASEKCPNQKVVNIVQSEQNANTSGCYAASVPNADPWTFISLPQAQRMCANAGKRLPKSSEWYQFALGTDPASCVISGNGVSKTGSDGCVSGAGIFDAVGNVWEWVDEQIVGNTFDNRSLPPEGYVSEVDAHGIATASGESANDLYGKDYFWSKEEDGVYGMIRGGFYGSGQDAGLYTTNASVPTSFATQGVGFRCVKDVL